MLRFLTGPAHALDTHACDAYNDRSEEHTSELQSQR